MKIYDISFVSCSNIVVTQPNSYNETSAVSTISNEPTTLITNIGLTYPGRIAPLKPISANESNSIYGFNTVGMSEIDPCFGWACSNTLKICGNVEICKNLFVHGHTQLVDTSVNNLEVSGNLVVDGHSWLQDTSTNNLDVSSNLEVFGHTQLVDISCATLQCDASSTVINGKSIINNHPAKFWQPGTSPMTATAMGLWVQANNLWLCIDASSNGDNDSPWRGMTIALPSDASTNFFRVVDSSNAPYDINDSDFAANPYLFEVGGDGITHTQYINPWFDLSYNIGRPSLRYQKGYFQSLFVTDISAIDISATNLTATNLTATGNTNFTGHFIFEDASGANLDISQNLSVVGELKSTSWLQFADASGGKLYVSIGLEVAGTTVLSGHLDFKDASGDNLTLDDSLDMGGDIDMNSNDIVDASGVSAKTFTAGGVTIPGTLSVWDGIGNNTLHAIGSTNIVNFGGYTANGTVVNRVVVDCSSGNPDLSNNGNILQLRGGLEILPNFQSSAPTVPYGSNISLGRYGFDISGVNPSYTQVQVPTNFDASGGGSGSGNVFCNRIRQQIFYLSDDASGISFPTNPSGVWQGNHTTANRQWYNGGDVKYLLVKAAGTVDASWNVVTLPKITEGMLGSTVHIVRTFSDAAFNSGTNTAGYPDYQTPVFIIPTGTDLFNIPNTVYVTGGVGLGTVGALALDPYNVLPGVAVANGLTLSGSFKNIATAELLATQVGDGMPSFPITTQYAWHMISRVRHI